MTWEERIEALAIEHEAFGFGRVDAKGFTTHGFDPEGLAAFARAIAEEAVRLERERIADDWEHRHGFDKHGVAAAIRSRSKSPPFTVKSPGSW